MPSVTETHKPAAPAHPEPTTPEGAEPGPLTPCRTCGMCPEELQGRRFCPDCP